jgi:hypothetical protein
MKKHEAPLQFDLYSLSDKFPVARSVAALALTAALLVPTGTETNDEAFFAQTESLAVEVA